MQSEVLQLLFVPLGSSKSCQLTWSKVIWAFVITWCLSSVISSHLILLGQIELNITVSMYGRYFINIAHLSFQKKYDHHGPFLFLICWNIIKKLLWNRMARMKQYFTGSSYAKSFTKYAHLSLSYEKKNHDHY